MTQLIDENLEIVRINAGFYHCALLAILLHFGKE